MREWCMLMAIVLTNKINTLTPETMANSSTKRACDAVWAAVFGWRRALSFSSSGRLNNYVSGRCLYIAAAQTCRGTCS